MSDQSSGSDAPPVPLIRPPCHRELAAHGVDDAPVLVQLEGLVRATAVPIDSSCAAACAWRTEPRPTRRRTPSTLRALNPSAAANGRAAVRIHGRQLAQRTCDFRAVLEESVRARLRLDELHLHVRNGSTAAGMVP